MKKLLKLFGIISVFTLLISCQSTETVSSADTKKEESNIMEETKVIKYGTVNHFTYDSKTCGMTRGVNVLLPADYDPADTEKTYPVYYMLHGYFGNEYSFTGDASCKIKDYAANAAADGKEMIIVFPDDFAKTDPAAKPDWNQQSVDYYDNFINDLVNDLMPFIQKMFNIKTGRENTAIAGFSMGGRESLFIGLQRPDLFGYVGAFAPAPGLVPGRDATMPHPGQMKEEDVHFEGKEAPFYLQVCVGDCDNVVGQFPRLYHLLFEKNNVEHTWFQVIGAGHDSSIVNPGSEKFISEIFN